MDDVLDLSLDELLTTTRAVRKRLDFDRPVSRQTIERCLQIGFQAPSGENLQAWGWVAVDDPKIRAQMGDIYRAGVDTFVKESTQAADDIDVKDLVESYDQSQAKDEGPVARMGMEVTDAAGTSKVWESSLHLYHHIQEAPVLVVPLLKARFDTFRLFEAASAWGSVLPAAWNFMLALRSRGLGSTWTTGHLWCDKDMTDLLGLPPTTPRSGFSPSPTQKAPASSPHAAGRCRMSCIGTAGRAESLSCGRGTQ
ncbi:nitroreductase family protein [Mycobacterium sp. MS1601]|uniref:nitroreductase family protein n=1 Tax=Mycobacterium sp. MS1601 TaxID=1936029 RepID=UPI0026B78208